MKIDSKKLILLLLILVLFTVGVINREHLNKENLEFVHGNLGQWTPFAFIGLYSIIQVIFIPGTILTVIAGFLFGPLWGTIYSVIGATCGSTLAFLTARYIASDWVLQHNGAMFTKIKQGVEEQGWRFIAFARLVPVFPFTVLNHVFGLTKISAITYACTTFVFIIPNTFAYAYLGYIGEEAAHGAKGLMMKVSLALVLLVLLSLLPGLLAKMRRDKLK